MEADFTPWLARRVARPYPPPPEFIFACARLGMAR
jgi:hypothetical protein